jgi:hypothetical protein
VHGNNMKTLSTWIGVLAIVVLFPVAAAACSCVSGWPICQTYWDTPVVFSGTVTKVEEIRVPAGRPDAFYSKRRVLISVEESFRGDVSGVVPIATGAGGGDCGYHFEEGGSYLIYAYKNEEGQLSTGICSRTRPIEKAEEDLEFIRGLDKAKPVGTVFGNVLEYKPRRSDDNVRTQPLPLAGISVFLSNERTKYEAKTKEDGTFRFDDLPPGEFILKLLGPAGYWPQEIDQKFTVHPKGCVQTGHAFSLDSSISGRVIKADGTPASKISIHMIPVEQVNLNHQRDTYSASTDEEGRFSFRSMTPGAYYVGVRLLRITMSDFPYPRTFYPGTTKLEEAAVVTVIAGQPQTGLNFQLPPALKSRTIEGVVVMAHGKPAKNFSVHTMDIEYAKGGLGDGHSVELGSDGKFKITRPDGIAYAVHAYINLPDGNQMHAPPVSVPSKGNQTGLRLVISHPGGSCEKCRP